MRIPSARPPRYRLPGLSLVLALAACGSAPVHATVPAPKAPADLVTVRPEVLQFLADAQAHFPFEYVACLEGGQIGQTLVVDAFRPARILSRDRSRAAYIPCGGPAYLGTVHGHPSHDGLDFCGFSDVDTRTFLADTAATLDAVTCANGLWLVRLRRDPDTSYSIKPDGGR